MNNKKTAVLMATYNGEEYLRHQIESILNQSNNNFDLYIRDDNSTDQTVKIINEYVEKYPDKIFKVVDEKKSKGSCKNFLILLEYVYNLKKYDLFAFSDQDDFWLEDKMEILLKHYEKILDKDTPILIHTDLYVVDEKLNTICNSFFKYSKLQTSDKYKGFNNYLIQNNVTGCTMLINKKLVDMVDFSIEEIKMHDWYFALIASAFGKVELIQKPTIKYRQHANNVLGAKKLGGIKSIYNKLIKNNTIKKDLESVFIQAENFRKIYYDILSYNNKKLLNDWCELRNKSKFERLRIIYKYKIYKHGIIRILGEIIFI